MLDARPIQVLRVAGPALITIAAAASLGGAFVAMTFHWWLATALCAAVSFSTILYWLWTGTGDIPEQATRRAGPDLDLPLYASGPASVGWWAMFITMVGDGTAFGSLVFGYFFYWTIHSDFTAGAAGPGATWPMIALALFACSWGLTVAARRLNGRRNGRRHAAGARRRRGAHRCGGGRRVLGPLAGRRWIRPSTSIRPSSGS